VPAIRSGVSQRVESRGGKGDDHDSREPASSGGADRAGGPRRPKPIGKRCGALKEFWYVAMQRPPSSRPGVRSRAPCWGCRSCCSATSAGLRPRSATDACTATPASPPAMCCPVDASGALPRLDLRRIGALRRDPIAGPAQRGEVLDEAGHARSGLKLCPADVGRVRSFTTARAGRAGLRLHG
jgi:hypothetical protein